MGKFWKVRSASGAAAEVYDNSGATELRLNGTVVTSSDNTVRRAAIAADRAAMGAVSVSENHPNGQPKTWVQDGLSCSSTLDSYGRIATITIGGKVHTISWDGNGAGLPTVTVA